MTKQSPRNKKIASLLSVVCNDWLGKSSVLSGWRSFKQNVLGRRLRNSSVPAKRKPGIIRMYLAPLFFLMVFLFISTGLAQPEENNHPELYWQTIETEHFIVTYHQGTTRTANLVAKIAEEIYPHITGLYRYRPKNKTEFIIRDTDDYANGGAYFYDNKVEIYSENLDYILRGTHNWLRDVVTHEYSHIISLRKALKFGAHVPAGWFQVFGYEKERREDVVRGFPNVLVSYPVSGINIPVWFAEGTAQFQSPSKRFDYRDSHREMILRDRTVTGKLLDLKQMSVFGKNSIGNESSYNQGFAFVRFLAKTFGDSIVRDLADAASAPLNLDFNSALKKVSGVPADSIYRMWQHNLEETYSGRLQVVNKHLKIGKALQDKGIGNIYPVYSPDGKKVAYLESRSDYLSMNVLVVKDLKTGKKRALAGPVASSISWSPDGRYLVYARQTEVPSTGSTYRDLYIYDLKRRMEFRITRVLRATNPDWSHDGKQIAFVIENDGQTNLFVLELDEMIRLKNKESWQTRYYELDAHRLVQQVPPERKAHWQLFYRKTKFWGKAIRQVTCFTDGRQVYHPRWSLDDKNIVFDTSIKFARDIAQVDSHGGEIQFILNRRCDERYPIFNPKDGELYFACDKTGIFNIYSYNLKTGEVKPHTNVVGGAFMPTLNNKGDLIYSLYQNQGYKIFQIRRVNELPPEYLAYDTNYEAKIPQIQADDREVQALPAKPYHRTFSPLGFMPRLLIDYGTVKPGFYVYSNELLDKMLFFGGMDVNKDREYNIFTLFEFRQLKPTVYLEFYNQTAKIVDDYSDPEGFTVSNDKVKVDFNLMEADLGLRGTFRRFHWKLNYAYSWYRAKIGTHSYFVLADQKTEIFPTIRYSYLRGHSASFSLKRKEVLPEVDRSINPRYGYYFFLKYTRDWNRFLSGFNTNGGDLNEEYQKYYFNKFELDFERYLPVPATRHHSLSLRFQGGYIDQSVDDFFHFFAGSLIGLKGYPFYSIEGRKMAIGTATYRFPLARNLNFKIFSWYLDKIYLGTFYQYGDAWSEGSPDFKNFKSDVGFQVRLETYSWYMFPTRIFFEAAYPLKENRNKNIEYKQEWKFYLGILFDFDLRFDKVLRKFK